LKTSLPGSERFPTQYNWDSLFDELCRAHGLKWRQKRLLKSISQALNVVPAARLFIEPDWFVAASKTPDLQSRKSQLIELCEELFSREKKGAPPITPSFQEDNTTSETFTRV
jgi:hypothetical protein